MKRLLKIVLCLMICFSLLGCSAFNAKEEVNSNIKNNDNDAYANISVDSTMNVSSMIDIDTDISDSNKMYEMCEYLVLARIDSIDGGSNVALETGEYVYPYTYGKMTVLQVYKGDIKVGNQIGYVRMGGIISFDEYKKGLSPEQSDKMLNNMTEEPKYVKQTFGDDIDIEVGTNYLVYLTGTKTQGARPNHYPIIGWEAGLRPTSGNLKTRSSIKVYNNISKQWETLENVIPSDQ